MKDLLIPLVLLAAAVGVLYFVWAAPAARVDASARSINVYTGPYMVKELMFGIFMREANLQLDFTPPSLYKRSHKCPGRGGLTKPCQTVAMLPTMVAPTSTCTKHCTHTTIRQNDKSKATLP